ncbi:hypothetical protein VPH35_017427 [Triticum aestivum]|uniref:uncharacterized protein n=1 Tax=Triticum aestivum TaxID=4565 RepID=UPI000844055E|nr:uncharacterized protein LOC123178270 [Triticum aestivum]
MAAAIRHVGRRLGGGKAVYKPVVSPLVEDECRRLMPRLIYGGRQPIPFRFRPLSASAGGADVGNSNLHQPNAKPALDLDAKRAWGHRQIAEIETKKHDLFYLLAELDSRFPSHNKYFRDNRELIHHLFRHIEPNPSDALWRFCRWRERFNNCLVFGLPTMLATWMYLDWDGWKEMFADILGVSSLLSYLAQCLKPI